MSPHAEEIQQVLRRLEGRKGQARPQILRQQSRRAALPDQTTPRQRRKKRPHTGNIAALCAAWAEGRPKNSSDSEAAKALAHIAGPLRPSQITQIHTAAITGAWKLRLAVSTAHHCAGSLRRLLRFIENTAGITGLADTVPRLRAPKPRETIATPDDMRRAISQAHPWLRCAIALASYGAMRASDLLAIAPANYDTASGTLTFRQQKTGSEVTIPVAEPLRQALDNAPPGDPLTPFVSAYAGKPIGYDALSCAWTRLKRKAGINPRLNLHDLRRTVAVSLYDATLDLRVPQQMLGHKSLASTVRYLEHRDPAKLRAILQQMYTPKGPVQ